MYNIMYNIILHYNIINIYYINNYIILIYFIYIVCVCVCTHILYYII